MRERFSTPGMPSTIAFSGTLRVSSSLYLVQFKLSREDVVPYTKKKRAALLSVMGAWCCFLATDVNAADPQSPGASIKDCPACPELVVIPAGSFQMGTADSESVREDDEGPVRKVTFAKAFALGKYEVTFDEWEACVAERSCEPASDEGWGKGKRPVIHVNYDQALGYTKWLSTKTGKSYSLPSEAQWEYAARAGSADLTYWGRAAEQACTFANVYDTTSQAKLRQQWKSFPCDDGRAETAPVGSFSPNAFGLHDMLGNVWEWTLDCYVPTYANAPADGSAVMSSSCLKRMSRGGSWNVFPIWVRSTYRYGIEPVLRASNLGFRVVRVLD